MRSVMRLTVGMSRIASEGGSGPTAHKLRCSEVGDGVGSRDPTTKLGYGQWSGVRSALDADHMVAPPDP
ncbi:hypothetical protein U1Q18_046218 [Sarracenia purpurea var. burkii]